MSSRTRLVAAALAVGLAGCTSAQYDAAPTGPVPPPTGSAPHAPGDDAGASAREASPTSSPTSSTSSTPSRTPSPPPACPASGAVDDVVWTTADGGRSLAVTPSQALRECGGVLVQVDGIPPGWDEVLALGGEEADSPAMRQQFVCHLRFARTKATWNLEPWRPEVDEQTLLRTRCNP